MSQHTDQTTGQSQEDAFEFEKLYLAVRQAEGRIYTDSEVARLPDISSSHPFKSEWNKRKRSSKRLISYLKGKKKPLRILEVGCGNGWFSAKLARLRNASVLGIDVIASEIEQAQRVFQKENLELRQGSIGDATLGEGQFDVIVFAASLSYFGKIRNVLKQTVGLLKKGGEIHVIDTTYYHDRQVMAAAQRSREHFEKLGFSKMTKYYHHYSLDIFREFNYRIKLDPRRFFNKLRGEPFFWIKITK